MPNYSFVESPVAAPRKFGLYSVADVGLASPHELDGIEYFADNCEFGTTVATDVICGGAVSRTVSDGSRATVTRASFQIYVYTRCAGVNEFNDAKQRAIDILNRGEERAVEYRLGRLLATDASSVDLTVATPSPKRGMAVLEDWADANYAGQPTFTMARTALSMLASDGGLAIHGDHIETPLRSLAWGGNGITLGPASAAAAAGLAWMWVHGKVTVRLSPMLVTDPTFIQSTASANEVQTISITGTPAGGSYTLTFDGQTTTAITYNANAAAVTAALVALSNVESGDITVTGTYPNFTATFGGQYQTEDVPAITATSSLTGGTAPTVTIATTTPGTTLFGDNSYVTMATRSVVLDYDCMAPGAVKVTLPA